MLNAKSLGMAGGVLWGLCMFLGTFVGMYATGYGVPYFELLTSIYPGFELTVGGAFLGLFYGYLDGFISLFLLGWLYNKCDANCPLTGSKKK